MRVIVFKPGHALLIASYNCGITFFKRLEARSKLVDGYHIGPPEDPLKMEVIMMKTVKMEISLDSGDEIVFQEGSGT